MRNVPNKTFHLVTSGGIRCAIPPCADYFLSFFSLSSATASRTPAAAPRGAPTAMPVADIAPTAPKTGRATIAATPTAEPIAAFFSALMNDNHAVTLLGDRVVVTMNGKFLPYKSW
jgi:hypothetical protein